MNEQEHHNHNITGRDNLKRSALEILVSGWKQIQEEEREQKDKHNVKKRKAEDEIHGDDSDTPAKQVKQEVSVIKSSPRRSPASTRSPKRLTHTCEQCFQLSQSDDFKQFAELVSDGTMNTMIDLPSLFSDCQRSVERACTLFFNKASFVKRTYKIRPGERTCAHVSY